MSTRTFIPKGLLNRDSVPQIKRICEYVQTHGISLSAAVNSLCLNELDRLPQTAGVRALTAELEDEFDGYLRDTALPAEDDAVGVIYQSLLAEGKKSALGSYYTPRAVVAEMLRDVHGVLLDPACGSGNFLLSSQLPPDRLIGLDIDPLAVRIAKTNLFRKFRGLDFEPQIYCADFLTSDYTADVVATNPPWGGKGFNPELSGLAGTRETYALFTVKAMQTAPDVRLVLPDSLLSVKAYAQLRQLLSPSLSRLVLFGRTFDRVMSRAVGVFLTDAPAPYVSVCKEEECLVDRNNLTDTWMLCDEEETDEIKRYYEVPHTPLTADYAIGIVTGANDKLVSRVPLEGYEPVITGKEVNRYVLSPPKYYIQYDRKRFQQAAPEAAYRREKLVYKFICSRLVVAYDNTGYLTLNSANILVPRGMNIKYVLAVLNSDVIATIYERVFQTIKVVQNSLARLPIPDVSERRQTEIAAEVDLVLSGKPDDDLQQMVRELFVLQDN